MSSIPNNPVISAVPTQQQQQQQQQTSTVQSHQYILTKIANIQPSSAFKEQQQVSQRQLVFIFIVLETIAEQQLSRNLSKDTPPISKYLVADETGTIPLVLWDFQHTMKPGEIYRLTGGYGQIYKGKIALHKLKRISKLERIGEFTMIFNETNNVSTSFFINNPNFKEYKDFK